MQAVIKYRHNAMRVDSFESFAGIRAGGSQGLRDVLFVRMLGWNGHLMDDIRRMDGRLCAEMDKGRLFYRRVSALPRLSAPDDIAYYTGCYGQWASGQDGVFTKVSGSSQSLARQLGAALKETVGKNFSGRQAATDSMKKNFAVKLLFWFDFVCSGLSWDANGCMKVVADNVIKGQEYLFYYFLTLIGCDVLLIQSREDIQDAGYKKLSGEIKAGSFHPDKIQEFHAKECAVRQLHRRGPQPPSCRAETAQRKEKSFEQLALLASSVVLISIHDKHGDAIGTGSGIMVGKGGYILTNDHVTRGGYSYSVRIENDDAVYTTDELIKYHPVLDLAILRIDRRLEPLPVYKGPGKLVRGQSVVAIGSPLGLFNSVSDGIISGFRNLDGVDMIQFTAPISQGSSGGAVLNMYGEVIGISTAGFDKGQNINLAVGYENINLFIQGFQS